MLSSTINSLSAVTSSTDTSTSKVAAADSVAAQDRFMKLLVAQLANQDPMNPMDNAQMTSQIAQINTVTGIQQVNDTLKSMAGQFTSLQVLQGASMVGHDVLVQGSTLTRNNGVAKGAIDLTATADSVKIEILTPGGQLMDTINLGAQAAGRHSFEWNAVSYQGNGEPSFRVVATRAGQAVDAVSLTQNRVISVASDTAGMTVQLEGTGSVAYSAIKAIL
jgi:flagellar basal-body rod modification protein FlgD